MTKVKLAAAPSILVAMFAHAATLGGTERYCFVMPCPKSQAGWRLQRKSDSRTGRGIARPQGQW